eukprot:scaffold60710_cov31-Tisochrysis_lutea.AAC.3
MSRSVRSPCSRFFMSLKRTMKGHAAMSSRSFELSGPLPTRHTCSGQRIGGTLPLLGSMRASISLRELLPIRKAIPRLGVGTRREAPPKSWKLRLAQKGHKYLLVV